MTGPAPSRGSMRSALSFSASIVPETLPSLMPTAAALVASRGEPLRFAMAIMTRFSFGLNALKMARRCARASARAALCAGDRKDVLHLVEYDQRLLAGALVQLAWQVQQSQQDSLAVGSRVGGDARRKPSCGE